MVSKKRKEIDREGVLEAIRAAVKAGNGQPLALRKFLVVAKMNSRDVFGHFSRWSDALLAAGFKFRKYNEPIPMDQLLEDWGRVARKLGKEPTHGDYQIHGKHSTNVLIKRLGTWSKICDAFHAFARRSGEWDDVIVRLPPEGTPPADGRRRPKVIPRPYSAIRHAGRFNDRPVCGVPFDFGGLRYAPVNEMGVVFLFGEMARKLGFLVESMQGRFPDCEAKRQVGPNEWQTARIEFEYESRNFYEHLHDPEGCDVIVCWNHNWPECPEHIEVIALSEHVARLSTEKNITSSPSGNAFAAGYSPSVSL